MANSEWRTVKLEEIAKEITVGFVGSMVQEYVTDGIPFLRSQNIEPFQINNKDLKFISPAFHKKIKKSSLAPGDVVIVRTGKPGACALVPEWLEDANCSDIVIVRCGPELDARFLVYYVNSVASHHVASHTVGAVQQHFNVGAARKLQLHLPPLEEQRRIAHILGALDDKIELNRQLNATLEQLARALFQSWFVDFDPVRAKASGEAPESICRRLGLTPELLALFPAELEDSALGEVPAGWRASTVDEEFNLVMGQSPPGDTYNSEGEGLPFYQGRTDFGFRFPTPRIYCTAPTRYASIGDTLISVRAPVGDINLANERCAIGRGVAAARHNSGSRIYTYEMMRSLKSKFDTFNGEGTVFGSINKKAFHSMKCIAPQQVAIDAFDKMLGAVEGSVENNELESRTLAALRDELLPKLVAGDIRLN